MKTRPLLALTLALLIGSTWAAVVRPAPEIALQLGAKTVPLRSFHGQAVVALFAESPSSRTFRSQVKELETMYDHFAASKVVFVAAFKDGSTDPVRSNIPFVVSSSGTAACTAYDLKGKFAIAIVGADGNLDYVTEQTLHANRVREVLQNSFTVQQSARQR